jgi:PDZ domain-containing protein
MNFTVLRDEFECQITLSEADLNGIGGYVLYDINYETIFPQISYNLGNAGGPSGGFLKTLSIFNKLTSFDYSRGLKIAGTGTIEPDGKVGKIGGVEQKVYAAFDDNVDIFFCPMDNYKDALKAYNSIKNKERMALVMVEYFNDAIEYLENV